MSKKSLKYLILIGIIQTLTHLWVINKPPMSIHTWRQCNTLAVAENFYEEKNPIWLPTIDRRNETNGITGMPFPIYEYALSKFIYLSGNKFSTYRIFALLISIFTMFFFFLLVKNLFKSEHLGLLAAFILMSIPEYFYHSLNALPDNLALLFGIMSLYFSLKINLNPNIKNIFLWFIVSSLSGLIKIQFLILPFASIFINFNYTKLKLLILPFLITIFMNFLWYFYALKLTKLNNLKEFGLWILPTSFSEKLEIIKSNLISDLPDLIIGFPIFIVFLCAIFYQFYKKNILFPLYIKIGLICFTIFYFIAIERMKHHAYYFLVLIPFIILILIENIKNLKFNKILLLSFVFISISWANIRIFSTRWQISKAELPTEFLEKDSLKKLKTMINPSEIVAIGPDKSGCIYFFFTNSKGFSFAHSQELHEFENGELKMDKFIRLGIKQLIFENKNKTSYTHEMLKIKGKVGNFWVYEVIEMDKK